MNVRCLLAIYDAGDLGVKNPDNQLGASHLVNAAARQSEAKNFLRDLKKRFGEVKVTE